MPDAIFSHFLDEAIEAEAESFVESPDYSVEELEWALNWLIWGDDVPERYRIGEPA